MVLCTILIWLPKFGLGGPTLAVKIGPAIARRYVESMVVPNQNAKSRDLVAVDLLIRASTNQK